jgi:ADP-ribosylglycohydrolase
VNAQLDDYADALLHAVNLGEDTDTTGCVAGGLAGLIYGKKGIILIASVRGRFDHPRPTSS